MGIARIAALLLPMLLPVVPDLAAAQTAMAYSEPDDSFGWCSSQNSAQDAVNCARIQCIDAKGADCRVVLECRGGWMAIAVGNPGFGMVCERRSDSYARQAALFTCMLATHRRCTTFDTVNDSNGSVRSAEDNREFDRAFYTQLILGAGDYDVGELDGKIGPRTRKAIRAFQADFNLPDTGEADDATFEAMLAAIGGDGGLVARVIEAVSMPEAGTEAALTTAYSAGSTGPSDLPSTEDTLPAGEGGESPPPVVAGGPSCVPGTPGFKLPGQDALPVADYIDKAAGGDKQAFDLLCNLANGGDAAFSAALATVFERLGDAGAAAQWKAIAGGGPMQQPGPLSPEEKANLGGK